MLNHLKVIKMDLVHIDAVMELEDLCFTVPWSKNAFIEEVTHNHFARYLVALSEEKVVGYAGMWKICDEGHITNIAVHPDYRKNGIGSVLVEELIDLSQKETITSMTLEVREHNIAAQALYAKYGFSIAGKRRGYYADNGEDAIIMWKNDMS